MWVHIPGFLKIVPRSANCPYCFPSFFAVSFFCRFLVLFHFFKFLMKFFKYFLFIFAILHYIFWLDVNMFLYPLCIDALKYCLNITHVSIFQKTSEIKKILNYAQPYLNSFLLWNDRFEIFLARHLTLWKDHSWLWNNFKKFLKAFVFKAFVNSD